MKGHLSRLRPELNCRYLPLDAGARSGASQGPYRGGADHRADTREIGLSRLGELRSDGEDPPVQAEEPERLAISQQLDHVDAGAAAGSGKRRVRVAAAFQKALTPRALPRDDLFQNVRTPVP